MAENVQISLGIKSETKQAQQDVSSLNKALKELQSIAGSVGKGDSILNYGKQIKAVANEIASINGRNNIRKAIEAFNETPSIGNLTKFAKAVESEYDRTAREVETAAKRAAAGMKSMSDAANASQQSTKGLGSVFKSLKTTLASADYPFKNFTKSLMRIAKLRLLRGIIRSITGAVREGTENLYRYSQALGAADASHFANSMDSLASSMLYMKNSIGAVVAPLIASLVPAIQNVVSWFVTATNAIAQFFAALNGQFVYTKAKEHATEWKAVEGAVGGAAAAAKEYENTILGFDELHVLNDVPQGGGGGGGGGAATPDYSDMFEEATISSKIRKTVEWLKEHFQDILDIVKHIGMALALWKISTMVLDFLESLGYASSAGIKELSFGVLLTLTGISLSYQSGFDIGYEGADFMNVLKNALGIAMAGAGGALIAHAITALGIASVGTGVGFVFGVGIAIVASIVGITLGEGARQRAQIIANLEEYTGEIQMILDSQNHWFEVSEQAWDAYYTKIASLDYAEHIVDQLSDMQQQGEYTSGEIEMIKTLIDELNGLGLDGITANWNESTKQIELNTQAVKDNIEQLREQYKQEAYKEVYIQALKDEAEQTINVAKSKRLVEKAQRDYNAKLATYQDAADALGITLEELAQANGFENTMLAEEKYALDVANNALAESEEKLADAKDASNDCAVALGYVSDSATDAADGINNVSNAVNNFTQVDPSFAQNVYDMLSKVSWWANDAWVKLYNVNQELANLGKNLITGNLSGIAISLTTTKGDYARGGFVNGYANGGYIPAYASGGINSADLFLANENNNPELVGRIGNRTAVANQGQLVEALAIGFERTLSNMNSGSSNIEVVVNMDGVAVARANNRGQKALNRRFNVNLA